MKKTLATLLSLALALSLLLGCATAVAEEEAPSLPLAYIMYANADWSAQYWGSDDGSGVQATTVEMADYGRHTVALDFTGIEAGESAGLAFMALGIKDGEAAFPKASLRIEEIRVNGEAIEFGKGYTSSDDGVETRMNIYNEWVSDIPEDAHSWDGSLDGASPIIVDKEAFAAVKTVEIDFELLPLPHTAYIMFANADWSMQYWGGMPDNNIGATTVEADHYGSYTVGLDFTATEAGESAGLAFMAVGLKNGEDAMRKPYIRIDAIRVNGEDIAFTKGYTSSDDGVETRMNVYNEWVSDLPEDARSWDGTVEDAAPIIVSKDDFESVKTIEIDFELIPVTDTAYLMYANSDWSAQYWGGEPEGGIAAATAEVSGEGSYTVGLDFTGTEAGSAAGLAFAAVGVTTGEQTFPGWFIDVKEVKVNGEAIELGKGYTASDDGVTTRENLYNEWVTELPVDARRADGDLEGASPIIVDPAAFENVETIEVTFDFIYGEPPVASEDAPLTEDEIAAIQAGSFNAYIGIQTDSYIFRNEWNEANYGRDSEENPGFFDRLTGWDADSNAVDYGGTFVDALIDHNGEYTVSLTTGEMGFGADEHIRMLFVSTEIPSKAVKEGVITIDDVSVKFGEKGAQKYTEINTSGDYARITILDEYSQSAEPVGYTMPGADTTVSITFTVSGLAE